MEWTDRRLYSRETATVTAKCLWVAGSYARGAIECGDLDLILEIAVEGHHPPTPTIAKSLFGAAQDTTLYTGTPDRNSSNVAFPEARLVWSEVSPDWKANIANISPDPNAGRFARATDALPLRPDQVSADVEELERLLDLKDRRVLDWEFIDAASVTTNPAALKDAGLHPEFYGAKTRDALQLVISHHASLGREGKWMQAGVNERTRFRCGGTFFVTANPEIPLDQLENPIYDKLTVVPHRSRRGPNGIWLVGRGPEHPVEKLFSGRSAHYVTSSGEPVRFMDVTHSRHKPATGIELFHAEDDALDHAEIERDFVEDDDAVEVARAEGSQLLQLIAGCDLVLVNGESFALSRIGQLATQTGAEDEVRIARAEELAAALATG
jgi:hypothetical protein